MVVVELDVLGQQQPELAVPVERVRRAVERRVVRVAEAERCRQSMTSYCEQFASLSRDAMQYSMRIVDDTHPHSMSLFGIYMYMYMYLYIERVMLHSAVHEISVGRSGVQTTVSCRLIVAAVGGFSLRVVLVEAVVLVVLPLTAVEPGRHVAHPV